LLEAERQFQPAQGAGRWRVSIYPDENIPIEEQMMPQALDASLQVIVPRPVTYDIAEQRPYRVHMRMVETTGAPHAVAGDAAHLNTPAGGMGLNGGIRRLSLPPRWSTCCGAAGRRIGRPHDPAAADRA
jgi:3-(3-hydroxy-phenyl)propionate hydroxylase